MNWPRGGGVIIGVRNNLSIPIFSDGKRRSHRVLFYRSCKDKVPGNLPSQNGCFKKPLLYWIPTSVSGFRTEKMLFEIYFHCLTSSRYLYPCLGASVGSVAFHNGWDHRVTPWMALATIKIFKLTWSAVGRLLSQGRLAICTLWNWSLTKYMMEEEQQSSGLECMEASTCIWGPAFQMLFCYWLHKQNSDLYMKPK